MRWPVDRMAPMPLVINGERVEDRVLAAEAESLRQRFQRLSEDEQKKYGIGPGNMRTVAVEWARENVIEQVLLRQRAHRDKAPLNESEVERNLEMVIQRQGGPDKVAEAGLDAKRLRADIETRMRVDRLVGKLTARMKPPRPKELAEFYRRNKARFSTAETVRAAHIVKNVEKGVTESQAKQAAAGLHARLLAGEAFEDVADRYSDCPGNGGDLGYFQRGKMVKEFEEVVFALKVGEISGVFRTVFGFHIAKLLGRRPAGLRPFREVRAEIAEEIGNQRRTKALERYVDRLRESATIKF